MSLGTVKLSSFRRSALSALLLAGLALSGCVYYPTYGYGYGYAPGYYAPPVSATVVVGGWGRGCWHCWR